MNLKEKFLSIKTYEEFDKRRDEFGNLDMSDEETRDHLSVIFGKCGVINPTPDGVMMEFTKEKPQK